MVRCGTPMGRRGRWPRSWLQRRRTRLFTGNGGPHAPVATCRPRRAPLAGSCLATGMWSTGLEVRVGAVIRGGPPRTRTCREARCRHLGRCHRREVVSLRVARSSTASSGRTAGALSAMVGLLADSVMRGDRRRHGRRGVVLVHAAGAMTHGGAIAHHRQTGVNPREMEVGGPPQRAPVVIVHRQESPPGPRCSSC